MDFNVITPWMFIWIAPLAIWSLIWKGFALWRAARRREVGWFIVLLIVNTLGILEIIYLLVTKNPDKQSSK